MKILAIFFIFLFLSNEVICEEIAIVNGKSITQSHVNQFLDLLIKQGADDSEELREQVKQEIINRQIFLQAAYEAGILEREDIKSELSFAYESILVRTLMSDYLKANPISEESIRTEYEKIKLEQIETKEFKLRHILLEDEKTANIILSKIKKNRKKFDELARKESKDFGSSEKGGDLGWSVPENYVLPFSEAIKNLKKGDITDKLVKTEFGWHIIQVDDIRPIEFIDFDQAKSKIEEILQKQSLASYQKQLIEQANVEMK
ncbi:MAG: peptidylprolyl isomerase [Bordetella sp.]|nr:MAG: peptidylprolyl isomerase [Bordetella sp.]